MKLKTLILSAVMGVLPLVGASAADMPMKSAPNIFTTHTSAYNWSGFYIGINAGYGFAKTVIDDQNCNISCSSQTLTPDGFTVGGTAGYNWQFGAAVLGIEGDWNYISAKSSYSAEPGWGSHSSEINSFATLRGRAGLAFDRALVYVTGGVAWVDQTVSANYVAGNNGFTVDETRTGFVAGVGAEYAILPNWTAKAEYLYIGLPADNRIPDRTCTLSYCVYNVTTDLHVLRGGLNYRF